MASRGCQSNLWCHVYSLRLRKQFCNLPSSSCSALRKYLAASNPRKQLSVLGAYHPSILCSNNYRARVLAFSVCYCLCDQAHDPRFSPLGPRNQHRSRKGLAFGFDNFRKSASRSHTPCHIYSDSGPPNSIAVQVDVTYSPRVWILFHTQSSDSS